MRRVTDEVEKEECCGFCKHHKKDGRDYICDNEESDCYGCSTMYRDYCENYEERSGRWERHNAKEY